MSPHHNQAEHQKPSHDKLHDPNIDIRDLFTQEFWDERYGSAERIWSGNPNPQVVTHVADLPPGTALDLGCGEGADAVWLAARGWHVTAVDVSTVALERAAREAVKVGQEVADRINWKQVDALSWAPPSGLFDLVSAQFVHPPVELRDEVSRRLAAAVRPGGMLLIVGHHPSDTETIGRPKHLSDLMFTPDQIAVALDPTEWERIQALIPSREVTDADGQAVTIHDSVLVAVRRT
jgi:SAM-dependent methyltransferase